MAKSKAFVKDIYPNQQDGIHQTSPSWMLTFVRWDKRSLFGYDTEGDPQDLLETRRPLIVINDCASLSVNIHKENHTHQMTALLYPGDINYLTAVAPGDFVLVNMVRWDSMVDRLYEKAHNRQPINGPNDGFKGIFKIQSVRQTLGVDPTTGVKRLMYQVTGFAFTEFNNKIYFNPHLYTATERNNDFLFVTKLGDNFQQFIKATAEGDNNLRDLLKFLIESFLGSGIKRGSVVKELRQEEQTHFFMPGLVGNLLGVSAKQGKTLAAKDIYTYIFGVQQFGAPPKASLANVLNPIGLQKLDENFYFTPEPCKGKTYVPAEFWNQVPAWDILNQFTNSPLNELFTSFRLTPDNKVMPTVVYRQTPMTSEKFKLDYKVTRFFNLPRWRIHPNLIMDLNLGRDEAARVNFVQIFGASQNLSRDGQNAAMVFQIANGNYEIDRLDIIRSGLRPIIRTTNFDLLSEGKLSVGAPMWAKILGDALIGGHLKLNGHLTCVGIQDPIAIGDNLEFNGTVFHIESITHNCSISPQGNRVFSTTIEVSHGINLASDQKGKVFSEMVHTDAQSNQARDYEREKVLPGLSDEQAIPSRIKNQRFGDSATDQETFESRPKQGGQKDSKGSPKTKGKSKP